MTDEITMLRQGKQLLDYANAKPSGAAPGRTSIAGKTSPRSIPPAAKRSGKSSASRSARATRHDVCREIRSRPRVVGYQYWQEASLISQVKSSTTSTTTPALDVTYVPVQRAGNQEAQGLRVGRKRNSAGGSQDGRGFESGGDDYRISPSDSPRATRAFAATHGNWR